MKVSRKISALAGLAAILLLIPKSSTAGILSASFAVMLSNSVVNLSAQGPLDWVHWGLDTEYGFDRKASVSAQIGPLTPILTGAGAGPYRYGDNFNGYGWTDGVPNTFATNTTTGVYVLGKACGFQLSIPADAILRTLRVYVGSFGTQGEFSAVLSDNSAAAYTNSAIDNVTNGPSGVYTINYAADSAGQLLTITYVVKRQYDNHVGNVTWQAAALSYAASNNPPTATLTEPANNAIFSTLAAIPLAAIASDSDGTISKVEFFEGATKLGESTNGDYALAWSNAPPGDYHLRAVATDDGGLTYTSSPVEIFVNSNGGWLSGSIVALAATVDLTADGTLDWAHWGLAASNSFDHKDGVTGQIPEAGLIGTNALQQLITYPTGFNWSDGTPTPSASGTTTGVFIIGLTNGFALAIPASTTLQTLKLYVGLYAGQGNLQAFLGDFSAPAFSDISLQSLYGNTYGMYTLNFAAATPGQTLNVRFTADALYDLTYGNTTLEAATLSSVAAPQPVSLLNPAWNNGAFGFSFVTESNHAYTVEFTDSLMPAFWQALTNVSGDGTPAFISDPVPNPTQRFYRVGAQ